MYSSVNVVLKVFPLFPTGICNCSETDYVTAFVKFAVEENYCIAVLNHVGVPQNVLITGNRIFTYGERKVQ